MNTGAAAKYVEIAPRVAPLTFTGMKRTHPTISLWVRQVIVHQKHFKYSDQAPTVWNTF